MRAQEKVYAGLIKENSQQDGNQTSDLQILVTQKSPKNVKRKRSQDKFNISGSVIGYERRSPSDKDTKATSGNFILRKNKPQFSDTEKYLHQRSNLKDFKKCVEELYKKGDSGDEQTGHTNVHRTSDYLTRVERIMEETKPTAAEAHMVNSESADSQ